MKKILLSLFVCVVSLISFGYCDYLVGYEETIINNASNNYNGTGIFIPSGSCFVSNNTSNTCIRSFYFKDVNGNLIYESSSSNHYYDSLYCTNIDGYITISTNNTECFWYIFTGVSSFFSNSSSCPDCPSCDKTAHLGVYQGGQLIEGIDSSQGVYSLYLSDGLDFSYSAGALTELYVSGSGFECGSGTDLSGDLQYSNLYINNILHPGTQNIFVDIPDYITWDYTTTGDDFNLYVGSGYDVDYINSVVDINSYRPTSGDFTNVFVSGLTLIMPYIVILLFIVFIWKFIKRIFK